MKKGKILLAMFLLCAYAQGAWAQGDGNTTRPTIYSGSVNATDLLVGDILAEGASLYRSDDITTYFITAYRWGRDASTIRDYQYKISPSLDFIKVNEQGVFSRDKDITIPIYPITAEKTLGNAWQVVAKDAVSIELAGVYVFPWNGSGTADDPFLINSEHDWNSLHTLVNEVHGKYFKQTADFTVEKGIGVTYEKNDLSFSGTYDGNGHKLTCNIVNHNLGQAIEAVAPFYKVKNATIKNLHVVGTISGGIYTAGLIAYTEGEYPDEINIENCRVSADITCTGLLNNNPDDATNAHGAGFVGNAAESVVKLYACMFDGKLTAKSNDQPIIRLASTIGKGGKVTIQKFIENATYEGMLTDHQSSFYCKDDGDFTPSASSSNIYLSQLYHTEGAKQALTVESGTELLTLILTNDNFAPGYFGAASEDNVCHNYIIDGKFYTVEGNHVPFKVSHPTYKKITHLYVNGTENDVVIDGIYSFTQGQDNTTITADLERVYWTDEGNYATEFSSGNSTAINIKNEAELARLAKLVSDGTDNGNGKYYYLDADLDMSKYEWTPIGGQLKRFLGHFDGQGHTISGISVPDDDKKFNGLFGIMNGTIKDLKLVNSKILGKRYVGGIVGESLGTIENCYVGSDVTVTAVAQDNDDDTGKDCGGVAGFMQNQPARTYDNISYEASDAELFGCYSAATVSGVSHVGGLVGNMSSGTVRHNVSQARLSGNSEVAYEVGNKAAGGSLEASYYVSDEESDNDYDTRGIRINLSEDLAKTGFKFDTPHDKVYDVSGLIFSSNSFMTGGELYGTDGHNVYFSIPEISGGCRIEGVLADGKIPQTTDNGFYFYEVSAEADNIVTGIAAVTLYDDSDINNTKENLRNDLILSYNNGRTASVTLQGRTLYKDNNWNTLCLPFDVNVSNSVLNGATVRTLDHSEFDEETGTLTLEFRDNTNNIKAGMPYIIRWSEGENIVNPKFENVTVKFNSSKPAEYIITVGEEDVDPVVFHGNYMNTTFTENEEGWTNCLYMGADSKLYYPDGSAFFSINCFRAYFYLQNGIVAGNPSSSNVKAIRLDFGDGEATDIMTTNFANSADKNDSWFTIDGRRLSGQPAQSGIYIHNGQKVMLK